MSNFWHCLHWWQWLGVGLLVLGAVGLVAFSHGGELDLALPGFSDRAKINSQQYLVIGTILLLTRLPVLVFVVTVFGWYLALGVLKVKRHPYRQELAGFDQLAIVFLWPVLGQMIEHWK